MKKSLRDSSASPGLKGAQALVVIASTMVVIVEIGSLAMLTKLVLSA